jgi:hypothetical protein
MSTTINKGTGALTQLYAYGASDVWIMTHDADAIPFNVPQYNSCYYLHDESDNSDKGMMTKSDLQELHEYSPMKHQNDPL